MASPHQRNVELRSEYLNITRLCGVQMTSCPLATNPALSGKKKKNYSVFLFVCTLQVNISFTIIFSTVKSATVLVCGHHNLLMSKTIYCLSSFF